jgi:hypothetical protein
MATEAQKLAARNHIARKKQGGSKALSIMLSQELHEYLQYKRAITPGGFNVSEFLRASLENMAKTDGYKL